MLTAFTEPFLLAFWGTPGMECVECVRRTCPTWQPALLSAPRDCVHWRVWLSLAHTCSSAAWYGIEWFLFTVFALDMVSRSVPRVHARHRAELPAHGRPWFGPCSVTAQRCTA